MNIFGLHPDRLAAENLRPLPSTGGAMLYGGVSFGVVSVVAYSIWAFKLLPDKGALYAVTALVYLGLGGLALGRLVVSPGPAWRFPACFATVFLAYAVGWCAGWFGLDGKHQADFWGAVVGLAAMTWLLQRAFDRPGGWPTLFLVLLACHSAGYYLGEQIYFAVRGSTGRLLWGAAYGVGFGAGLGFVLRRLQVRPESPR